MVLLLLPTTCNRREFPKEFNRLFEVLPEPEGNEVLLNTYKYPILDKVLSTLGAGIGDFKENLVVSLGKLYGYGHEYTPTNIEGVFVHRFYWWGQREGGGQTVILVSFNIPEKEFKIQKTIQR